MNTIRRGISETGDTRAGLTAVLATSALLAACGGGGGGGGGDGRVITPPPPPPTSRAGETVVYVAGDGVSINGLTELYAIEDDGSGRRRLSAESTTQGARIDAFKVSPDGNWVAFLTDVRRDQANVPSLYVAPTDGRADPLQVSQETGSRPQTVKTFDWSPDSQQLVYDGNFDQGAIPGAFGANEVFVVNRDGTGRTKINGAIRAGNEVLVEVRNPQWSPDGRYIVQEVFDWTNGRPAPTASKLNLFDTTTGVPNSARLVDARTVIQDVRWSEDGRRLSFVGDPVEARQYNVFTIGVGTSAGLTRVSDNGALYSESRWSPDSSRIAYLDHPSGPFPSDLVVSDGVPGALDTVIAFVSPDGRAVRQFEWSPNGQWLAYVVNAAAPNVYELFVERADGTGTPTRVNGPLTDGGDVLDFAWSPDGARIAYLADQDTDTFVHLYVSDVDGRNNTRLSAGLAGEEVDSLAWSKDAKRVSFTTGPEARTVLADKLYAVNPNGNNRVELTQPLTNGPVSLSY